MNTTISPFLQSLHDSEEKHSPFINGSWLKANLEEATKAVSERLDWMHVGIHNMKENKNNQESPFIVGVKACARCGQNHDVNFVKFLNPSGENTHWGMCPTTYEPILLRIIETD